MSNPKQSLRQPLVGVFDSGVGGLTVYREIRTLRPDAEFVYCADNKTCLTDFAAKKM